MIDKTKAYIGLAQRANAVLYGEDIICEKLHLVKVVLVSSSSGDKYKERIAKRTADCPIFFVDNLCEALHRDGVKAIAVTNETLANAIIGLLR